MERNIQIPNGMGTYVQEAFQTSCIWCCSSDHIDAVGEDEAEKELSELEYSNCDIFPKWEGSNINPYPELNGFWLNASLENFTLGASGSFIKNI